MISFHPKPQQKPITLREALEGIHNTQKELEESCYPPHSVCYQILCKMKQWEIGSKYHPNQSLFSLKRLAWNQPSRTVLKDQGVKNKACQCCHPTEQRRLTISELKRVSSFPDDLQLVGTTAGQWARLGNSVPPKFIENIATHVYETFLLPSKKGEE